MNERAAVAQQQSRGTRAGHEQQPVRHPPLRHHRDPLRKHQAERTHECETPHDAKQLQHHCRPQGREEHPVALRAGAARSIAAVARIVIRSPSIRRMSLIVGAPAIRSAGRTSHRRIRPPDHQTASPCSTAGRLFMLMPMALEWEQIIVDSSDPIALGQWWAEALGWVVVDKTEEIVEIRPEPDRLPGLLFVPVPEGKTAKNRLHPDFRPDDQEAEVARLIALGARRAEPAQEGQHWVTLFDPEGNEFCVLSEPRS